jgi:hypothetical protein
MFWEPINPTSPSTTSSLRWFRRRMRYTLREVRSRFMEPMARTPLTVACAATPPNFAHLTSLEGIWLNRSG